MRASTILAAVIASFFIGSTPVSSLSASSDRPQPKTCRAVEQRAISLVGSASGIALISSDGCRD